MAESSRAKRSSSTEETTELYEECLYEIFSHMPASDVEISVKCVSKSWKTTTEEFSFIEKNLAHSKPGLLIQNTTYTIFVRIRHFTMDKGVFEMTNAVESNCFRGRYSPQGFLFRRGSILASCDGSHKSLFAANILKNQLRRIFLPLNGYLLNSFCRIGRVPQTGQFKVLCPFVFRGRGLRCRWCITTIGADQSWREIDLPVDVHHPVINVRQLDMISCSGIIYLDKSSGSRHTTFAVDLSDESVHRIQVPNYNPPAPRECEILLGAIFHRPADYKFLVKRGDNDYFLPFDGRFVAMGNKVSFIVPEKKETKDVLHIYILSDFRNSKWEICNKFIHPKISKMFIDDNAVPVVWLDNDEVHICRVRKEKRRQQTYSWYAYGLVAYFVKTGKRKQLPSTEVCNTHTVTCHTDSLVWFKFGFLIVHRGHVPDAPESI